VLSISTCQPSSANTDYPVSVSLQYFLRHKGLERFNNRCTNTGSYCADDAVWLLASGLFPCILSLWLIALSLKRIHTYKGYINKNNNFSIFNNMLKISVSRDYIIQFNLESGSDKQDCRNDLGYCSFMIKAFESRRGSEQLIVLAYLPKDLHIFGWPWHL